jgi:undecaprenyl-diphosphatase
MQSLLELDATLFVLINSIWANPVTDFLMPLVTNGYNWIVPGVVTVIVILWKEGKRGVGIVFGMAIVIALCDQSAAHIIKPVVQRVRPCHVLDSVHLLVPCGAGFSFPSAHATNWFGGAVWLSYSFPRLTGVFYILAFLVAISRVFVGVHYPLDVIGGAMIGSALGLIVVIAAKKLKNR